MFISMFSGDLNISVIINVLDIYGWEEQTINHVLCMCPRTLQIYIHTFDDSLGIRKVFGIIDLFELRYLVQETANVMSRNLKYLSFP